MNSIELPTNYNYIGIFLTLSCNLTCSYCINHLVGLKQGRKLLNAEEWSRGLSRLKMKLDIPLTFQGGEPTIHKDFYSIINSIPGHYKLDLLTNIQFNPEEFARQIPVQRFTREAPYAPIRVSYHPETMNFEETKNKVKRLMGLGYNVGLYGVLHPSQIEEILRVEKICLDEGIDFRKKEFLGVFNERLYGEYAYPGAVFSETKKSCFCKTSELLIDPFGDVFRCHHDLYNKINSIGNILDPEFILKDEYRPCDYFGRCNPCDVKIKTNYLQEKGHTSVKILFQNKLN